MNKEAGQKSAVEGLGTTALHWRGQWFMTQVIRIGPLVNRFCPNPGFVPFYSFLFFGFFSDKDDAEGDAGL